MSWAGLTGLQFVSRTNAQGSGFRVIRTLPTSDEWLTKDDALYYLDLVASTWAALAGNQFVAKDDITSASPGENGWVYIDPTSVRAAVGGGSYYVTIISNNEETNTYTVDEFDSGSWFVSSLGSWSVYDSNHSTCILTITFDPNVSGVVRLGSCYLHTDLGLWGYIGIRQDEV